MKAVGSSFCLPLLFIPFCYFKVSTRHKSLLFSLEKDDFPATSYLFGTMHVQDLRAFGKLELVKEKIIDSDVFAVEFDLEDQGMAHTFQSTLIPDGQLLTDLIPEKKYGKLRRTFLKSTGFDLSRAARTLPFLLVGMISSHMLRKEMPTSLDEYLWNFAKAEGKETTGIETLAAQMEVLAQIPLEVQVKMLLSMGRNISATRKQFLQLTELYAKGDLKLLHRSVKKQAGGLRKIMLYKRNEVMAERIFELAKRQSTFAGVGAGHLSGGKGVIRKLKQRGVKVKPV